VVKFLDEHFDKYSLLGKLLSFDFCHLIFMNLAKQKTCTKISSEHTTEFRSTDQLFKHNLTFYVICAFTLQTDEWYFL
jgi:hypothetical protein